MIADMRPAFLPVRKTPARLRVDSKRYIFRRVQRPQLILRIDMRDMPLRLVRNKRGVSSLQIFRKYISAHARGLRHGGG